MDIAEEFVGAYNMRSNPTVVKFIDADHRTGHPTVRADVLSGRLTRLGGDLPPEEASGDIVRVALL